MRDANHYRRLLAKNAGAGVGFTLAAAAVYAAEYGLCEAAHRSSRQWRQLARRLRDEHGEELSADTVLELMDAADPPTVGRRIRALVDGRGWTMAHAAEMAGVTPPRLADLVTDRSSPTVDTLQRLADAWGCSLCDLHP